MPLIPNELFKRIWDREGERITEALLEQYRSGTGTTFTNHTPEPTTLTLEGLREACRRAERIVGIRMDEPAPFPQIVVDNGVPPGCIYVVSNGAPVVRWTIDAGLDPANFGATIPEPEPEIDYDRIDGYTVEEMIEMYKKRGKRDE